MSKSKFSLKFRIHHNGTLVRELTLAQPVIKIGKLSTSHLRVDDPSVSRMHAVIETNGTGETSIIDLGSTKGTFVNGQKINKAILCSGDVVNIGDTRIEVAMATSEAVASHAAVETPAATRTVRPGTMTARPVPSAPRPATPSVAPRAAAPTPAKPVAAAPMHTAFGNDTAASGDRAIEVAAMMGDSVIGVNHLSNPRAGTISKLSYGLVIAGAALLIMAGVAFAAGVQNAQFNKDSKSAWAQSGQPMYNWRPQLISPVFDWMTFGGLGAGMFALTLGFVRIRNEKGSPFYRIGSDADVEFPTSAAPASSFPLVAPRGDDFVLQYTADMDGDLDVRGEKLALSELVNRGLASASTSISGAFQMAIPLTARIRVNAGQNTFVISSVPKPRKHKTALLGALDSRVMSFFAGSAIVHMTLWAFLNTLPPDPEALALDLGSQDARITKVASVAQENPKDRDTDTEKPDDGGGSGTAMALEAGKMGSKTSKRTEGRRKLAKTSDTPKVAKEAAIRHARRSGILGSLSRNRGSMFHALTGTGSESSGLEDATVLGGMLGMAAGEMNGGFGASTGGFGPGGGGDGWGTIGTDNYGLIGNSSGIGDGYTPGNSDGISRRRKANVPKVKIGYPSQTDGLDKNIIRRYVRRKLARIKYCYEKQLLVKPSISGTVVSSFQITPQGAVIGSSAKGVDESVSGCVSEVISTIRFPKPKHGTLVEVKYPFTFRPSGG